MKIAFLVGQFPCLSETFILNQITGLLNRGHEVDIFASSPSNEEKIHPDVLKYRLLDRTFYQNMPVSKVQRIIKSTWLFLTNVHKPPILKKSTEFVKPNKQIPFLKLLFAAIPLLKQEPYDIVHCHFGPNGVLGIMLRDIGVLNGKVITHFHGGDISATMKLKGKKFYQSLFDKGDLFLCVSNYIKERLVGLGAPPEKVLKHPITVDPKKFVFKDNRASASKGIKLLTVARLTEKKGLEYSIRAFAEVQKTPSGKNMEYVIVGDGPLRYDLEDLIRKLEITDKVLITGWKDQDEVRALFNNSDLFILPSVTARNGDEEGTPTVLLEAMACGLPVISTQHSGIPEQVEDGKSGFLVPERSSEALAEKLVYLARHPEIRARMGAEGRRHAIKNWDIDKLNDQQLQIYERLLS